MKVYLVMRQAIYDRGVFGVYATLEEAKEGCVLAKSFEDDDHHDFRVMEYTLGEAVKIDDSWHHEYAPCVVWPVMEGGD